ncbi:MAG: glycosyltransferase family 2 protein [Candidatus Bathyarchaeota archaeon]|nr:glycosyltransferase family 2 protein [Candidatus Bathyarchaeota archaeon]
MIIQILTGFFVFSASIISLYLIRHYLFTITVLRRAKNSKSSANKSTLSFQPTVTVLIPAHNEEKVVSKLLQNMAQLIYPKEKLDILLINDGSTDDTGIIADQYAKKYSFIRVLHRNGKDSAKGKAAAMNAGLKQSSGEIVLCFDADYLPHPDLVSRLVEKFSDPKVGAVQGRPVVLNEPQNLVTRLVTLERIGGYRVDEEARDVLGLVPQFGGTVGGFRRSALEGFGGFDESMLTEDTDLTFHLYREGYKIRYVADAECYEEAVDSWSAYWRQRHRWAKGHMQVCFKHAFKVLSSKKMKLKEKIDGILILHIYFLPLLTVLSFLIGGLLILNGSQVTGLLWFVVPIALYSFVGNFAPFFEVGIGAYLDERKRIQWLTPFMIFSFFYNTLICTKAFLDLLSDKVRRKSKGDWEKTDHKGKGVSDI